MVEPIITQIVNTIAADLSWSDLYTGVAETIRETKQSEGGVEVKVYPAKRQDPNCSGGRYIPLTPDTSKKSVIYVDNLSEVQVEDNRRYSVYSCSCRLVVWLNKPLINPTVETYLFEQEVFEAIPYTPTPFSPYVYIRVTPGQIDRGADIFSAWSYSEPENQYATHPYDVFSINLEINYRIVKSCPNAVTESPDSCQIL